MSIILVRLVDSFLICENPGRFMQGSKKEKKMKRENKNNIESKINN